MRASLRYAFWIVGLFSGLLCLGAFAQNVLDAGLGSSRVNAKRPAITMQRDAYRLDRNTGTFRYDRAAAFHDNAYDMYGRFGVARTINNRTVASSGRTNPVRADRRQVHSTGQARALARQPYAVRSRNLPTGSLRSPLPSASMEIATKPMATPGAPTTPTPVIGTGRGDEPILSDLSSTTRGGEPGGVTLASLTEPSTTVQTRTYSILDRHARRTSRELYSIER